ncbi:MAG: hypothetical protein U0K25_08665 [Streptococcus sp.]|nr:hypothetical protein [Streptococcus sp.]
MKNSQQKFSWLVAVSAVSVIWIKNFILESNDLSEKLVYIGIYLLYLVLVLVKVFKPRKNKTSQFVLTPKSWTINY